MFNLPNQQIVLGMASEDPILHLFELLDAEAALEGDQVENGHRGSSALHSAFGLCLGLAITTVLEYV